jgi:hypothetical protein
MATSKAMKLVEQMRLIEPISPAPQPYQVDAKDDVYLFVYDLKKGMSE